MITYDHQVRHEYFANAIDDGIEAGPFRSVDSNAFAGLILAAIASVQAQIAIFGEGAETEPIVAAIETVITEYLVLEDESS
ncbi:hypothetical protein AB7C87_21890 [Natrarchaeobius sp. A-rgal3]|uniref:hypothetical protein n=1 Tax=Natrarchaeobius versutus TaxID=1679078 RepID=UPI0035102866